jgi:hypothetical protein
MDIDLIKKYQTQFLINQMLRNKIKNRIQLKK